MSSLLGLSRLIDKISTWVGKFTMWLILATTLISAGNALVRKIFDTSSNSLLEIQWYLFAGVFMLGAGYGFLKNSHVRIDFLASRTSARDTQLDRRGRHSGGLDSFLHPEHFSQLALLHAGTGFGGNVVKTPAV
jgi:hypothetical protein